MAVVTPGQPHLRQSGNGNREEPGLLDRLQPDETLPGVRFSEIVLSLTGRKRRELSKWVPQGPGIAKSAQNSDALMVQLRDVGSLPSNPLDRAEAAQRKSEIPRAASATENI